MQLLPIQLYLLPASRLQLPKAIAEVVISSPRAPMTFGVGLSKNKDVHNRCLVAGDCSFLSKIGCVVLVAFRIVATQNLFIRPTIFLLHLPSLFRSQSSGQDH